MHGHAHFWQVGSYLYLYGVVSWAMLFVLESISFTLVHYIWQYIAIFSCDAFAKNNFFVFQPLLLCGEGFQWVVHLHPRVNVVGHTNHDLGKFLIIIIAILTIIIMNVMGHTDMTSPFLIMTTIPILVISKLTQGWLRRLEPHNNSWKAGRIGLWRLGCSCHGPSHTHRLFSSFWSCHNFTKSKIIIHNQLTTDTCEYTWVSIKNFMQNF